jgi:hypothetical protein
MAAEEKDIFSKISNPGERAKLFNDLASSHVELVCKGKDDQLHRVRAQSFNSVSGHLECKTIDGRVPFADKEEVIGHFFLGSEKYYFQSITDVVLNKLHFVITEKVFHLQRRQNYRVIIPESYKATFDILRVNGQSQVLQGRLADLSGGGCRLVCNSSSSIKMDDQVVGTLRIAKRDPIDISGVIKHLKPDTNTKNSQIVGIEFTQLTPIIENRLVALTMDLYKEIFKNV